MGKKKAPTKAERLANKAAQLEKRKLDEYFETTAFFHPIVVKSKAMFHPFSRLPPEMRTRIWELTEPDPRVVEVRHRRTKGIPTESMCITSHTKPPSLLHACHESRRSAIKRGLYQKAFTIGCRPRYTWINFEHDMISIQPIDFKPLEWEKIMIQRLRFTGENDEGFYHFTSHELMEFISLKEVHVVCTRGLMDWRDVDMRWLGTHNVKFIDRMPPGRIVTEKELMDMYPVYSSC